MKKTVSQQAPPERNNFLGALLFGLSGFLSVLFALFGLGALAVQKISAFKRKDA